MENKDEIETITIDRVEFDGQNDRQYYTICDDDGVPILTLSGYDIDIKFNKLKLSNIKEVNKAFAKVISVLKDKLLSKLL